MPWIAPREKTFLLGASRSGGCSQGSRARLPRFVRPDHLTVLALAAAVAFAVAAATGHFWTAAALLVVHWFGDSLDGTLGAGAARRAAALRLLPRPSRRRVRDGAGRPRASGCRRTMHLFAGLVLVVAYLALSINSYLETQAFGRFSLGYGRLGPTEARLALIVLLSVVALGVEVSCSG